MEKWKRMLAIALVTSLFLGCASVNAQTSDENDESVWIAQHKLGIEKHKPNENFSADGVDKAQMNVVIRNKATGNLAKAPFDMRLEIDIRNDIAKPQIVNIPKDEAISEEISVTSKRFGIAHVTARADDFDPVNTSINFTKPDPEPHELLLEAYYKGKPVLADEYILDAGTNAILRVKLFDKNGQLIYSKEKYIDFLLQNESIPIQTIRKDNYYVDYYPYYYPDKGSINITAATGLKNGSTLNSNNIELKFATQPSMLLFEIFVGEANYTNNIIPLNNNIVKVQVKLYDENKRLIKSTQKIELNINISEDGIIPLTIFEGSSSGEISYTLKKPGYITFEAENKTLSINGSIEVPYAIPSRINLDVYSNGKKIGNNESILVYGSKVILNVSLVDKDGTFYKNGATILYYTSKMNDNKEISIDIGKSYGERTLLKQKPGKVTITAYSAEFSEIKHKSIDLNFISAFWMMIYAGLGGALSGFAIYFIKCSEDFGKLIASLLKSKIDYDRFLKMLSFVIIGLLAGSGVYILFCFGAFPEKVNFLKNVPLGEPIAAFLIGVVAGLTVIVILSVSRLLRKETKYFR